MDKRRSPSSVRAAGGLVVLAVLAVAAGCASPNFLDDWPRVRDRHATSLERAINASDTITVFSLHPFPEFDASGTFVKPPADQRVDSWRIHDSAVVSNHVDIAGLASALAAGMRENSGEAAMCFNPRHAIRLKDGRDIIICFECWQMRVRRGDQTTYYLTSDGPEKTFDEIFRRHGVDRWVPAEAVPATQ